MWDWIVIYLILLNMRDVFSCIFALIAILFDVNNDGKECTLLTIFNIVLLNYVLNIITDY